MDNPQIVACPKDQWEKVASGLISGLITINKWVDTEDKKAPSDLSYWVTYRLADDPAPTADNPNEGDRMLQAGYRFDVGSPIDIYVYCTGADGSVKISYGDTGVVPPEPPTPFILDSVEEGTQTGEITLLPKLHSNTVLTRPNPIKIEVSSAGIAFIVRGGTARELIAMNIQNPADPEEISVLDLATYGVGVVKDFIVDGSDIFILDYNDRIYNFKINNAGDIEYKDYFRDTAHVDINNITVNGAYIIAHCPNLTDDAGQLIFINRESLELITYFESATLATQCYDLEAVGNCIYCLTMYGSPVDGRLEIFEITDIYNVIELGKVTFTLEVPSVKTLRIQGEIAYASGQGYLYFFNIDNKTSPTLINSFEVESVITYPTIDSLVVWGDYLSWISSDGDEVGLLYIKDLEAPVSIGVIQDHDIINIPLSMIQYGNFIGIVSYSSNNLTFWDTHGYYFPSARIGSAFVDGKIQTNDSVKVGKNLQARGFVSGQSGYFSNHIYAPNIAPAYCYAEQNGVTTTTLTETNKFKRIAIPGPHGLISNYQQQFDLPYSGGVDLGLSFIGKGQHVFDILIVLEGKNLETPGAPEYPFTFGIYRGSTDSYFIAAISADGADMIVTTPNPHGLAVDDYVMIENTSGGTLDESGQITAVSDEYHFTLSTTKTGTDTQGRFFQMINESFRTLIFQGVLKQVVLSYKLSLKQYDVVYPIIAAAFSPAHNFYMVDSDMKVQR